MSSPLTLTVEAKVLGQRRPALPAWDVTLMPRPEAGAILTLRDLLTAVVSHEVAAFHARQEQRRLTRMLSPDEIEQGATRGKIGAGAYTGSQTVSVADAIATALQAFEDRLYLVFLDDRQIETLDQAVALREGGHLRFVRLIALVGG